VAAERDALSRAQIFAEALQSRINVLAADFVNRDDPAQRDVVAAERQKALAELDRVRQEIQQHQKAITTIQDEARRAGVPAGWTR
jgi:ATP-dependent exoDNAse (exonuclease V) alpha subunit